MRSHYRECCKVPRPLPKKTQLCCPTLFLAGFQAISTEAFSVPLNCSVFWHNKQL